MLKILIIINSVILSTFCLINSPKRNYKFCPKYHFQVEETCYLYFIGHRNYNSSKFTCKNISNHLVNLETERKFNGLITQLNNFRLQDYKFLIGLKLDHISNKWYWSNHSPFNDTFNLTWCNRQDKINSSNDLCALISFSKDLNEWCLEKVYCKKDASFICEWRSNILKRTNLKNVKIFISFFYYCFLFSLLSLIILCGFLINFIYKGQDYLEDYFKNVNEHLRDAEDSNYFNKVK